MLKLVVFDCDGVMFSSRESNRHYYNDLLAAFSCQPMDEEELNYVHIHNVRNSVAHIFRKHGHIDPQSIETYRLGLDYAPYLRFMAMEPDLLRFLALIKPAYRTAISTNRTDTMEIILDTFALRPWFEMVVTALNAPRPKPAPDGLFMIMDHFQVQPDEAIYIGDSVIDQEHCAGAGVDLIAFRNRALEARYHVDDFMSIAKLPPFRANS
ncbi:MAG: HAD hydrolase-like protein [Desulfobulbus sp.]|jgi:phosphoglycolate phosphatase-like HAD superfamily hydrolase|uniref:HAD family hydrolase n=1 Tax=Desulfobulbus sp. TaxID=895 RepID=UPI00283EB76C|nr:HAD hydrolase-like protein [Desulfobulbus sp.]MDR2551485.1 HAD hydrolase-like protein [Desulfobulbus sp.]